MTRTFISALLALPILSLTPTVDAAPQWIWLSKQAKDKEQVSLKKEFEVSAAVISAMLRVSVDNGATVYLNGKEAVKNANWDEPSRADVAKLLVQGKNELRIEAKNEGGVAAALATLSVELVGGEKFTIETDGGWLAAASGSANYQPAAVLAKHGDQPWGNVLGGRPSGGRGGSNSVVAADALEVPKGFRVELLYNVPKAEQGSWVALTVDGKGRIVAGDQYGGFYRITVPPIGAPDAAAQTKVEVLSAVNGPDGKPVSGAHGLLWAFDSLYVVVCEGPTKGLWRMKDTNNDDQFDKAELLRPMKGSGEHGPHSVVLSKDGKSLWLVAGNHTDLIEGFEHSRGVSWDEDHLIPRLWDANGHAKGKLAPGGVVYRCDPDGKNLEVYSTGFRNQYDVAFDANGELFTYDSDMEWDISAPWYRPTRIAHCVSGGDNGWRSGAGKWPSLYPDSVPPVLDIGPGSPTGVLFGTGAKFPAKYQRALYALDWTYGTMWAVHLQPQGAGFTAVKEEFVGGKPLPLTDAIIHPADGAMYFAVGGRRTQSGLYRVSYNGAESTAPAPAPAVTAEAQLRHSLEKLHDKGTGPEAIVKAWPYLSHEDRAVRFAARVAIEHQPVAQWSEKALTETNPQAAIEALIALARVGRSPAAIQAAAAMQKSLGISSGPLFATPPQDAPLQGRIVDALAKIDFTKLNTEQQHGLLRAWQLAFTRLGKPAPEVAARALAKLQPLFPSKDSLQNRELVSLLVFLDSPTIVARVVPLLATTQDAGETLLAENVLARNEGYAKAAQAMTESRPNRQAIAYAYALRIATAGWTPELRRAYFSWFPSTRQWKGGNSFPKFIENIRTESLARVPEAERAAFDAMSKKVAPTVAAAAVAPKGPGRAYTIDDIVRIAGAPLKGRDFANGKAMYTATLCAACHKFAGDGGNIGPDLTGSGSRYTIRDLAENLVEPSKVVSDQYESHEITLKDGGLMIGRIVGEENGNLLVMTSPFTPDELTQVPVAKVASRKPWAISMMPPGLINSLNEEELKDLIAYLQSGGNPQDKAFLK